MVTFSFVIEMSHTCLLVRLLNPVETRPGAHYSCRDLCLLSVMYITQISTLDY